MELKCRVCKIPIARKKLISLCNRCLEERDKYLESMNSNFPFLSEGAINKEVNALTLDKLPLHSDKLKCYQLINIPGSDTHILGKGTYGEVWLVENIESKKKYALKVIQRQSIGKVNRIKNLEQEINIQQRINHNNIIKLYDVMSDKESIYILMEYADGGNLFHYIRKRKKLTEKEAYKFFLQIATAINFLHKNSLLHRDIKPENILLTTEGTVKFCDFGCSTPYNEHTGMYFSF